MTNNYYSCRKGYHTIHRCEKFLKLNTNDRIAQLKKLALCINYLKPKYLVEDGQAPSCRRCNKKHYCLLLLYCLNCITYSSFWCNQDILLYK